MDFHPKTVFFAIALFVISMAIVDAIESDQSTTSTITSDQPTTTSFTHTCDADDVNCSANQTNQTLTKNKAITWSIYALFSIYGGTILGAYKVFSALGGTAVLSRLLKYWERQRLLEQLDRKLKNQRLPLLTTIWDIKWRLWGLLSPNDKDFFDKICHGDTADTQAVAYMTTHTTYLFGKLFHDLEKLRTDSFFSTHLDLALPLNKANMQINRAFSSNKFSIWPFPKGSKVNFTISVPLTVFEQICQRLWCCKYPRKERLTLVGWIRQKEKNEESGDESNDGYYAILPGCKPLHERVQFAVELDETSVKKCEDHNIEMIQLSSSSKTNKGLLVIDSLEQDGKTINEKDRMTACDALFDDNILCIFKGDQRAMGQEMMTMVPTETEGKLECRCLTYNEFIIKLEKDSNFAHWFDHIRAQLRWVLTGEPCNECETVVTKCGSFMPRLMTIHNYLVDLVDIIDQNGMIATNVWGNTKQVYFDSRGMSIEEDKIVQSSNTGDNNSPNFRTRSGRSNSALNVKAGLRSYSVTSNDKDREILRTDSITQQIRDAFPVPAVASNERLVQEYTLNVSELKTRRESLVHVATHTFDEKEMKTE